MKKVLPILMLLALIGLNKISAQTSYISADFENSLLPVGWNSTTAGTGGQWLFGSGFNIGGYMPLDPHTKYACISDVNCACIEDSARLTTNTVNMSLATTVYMTFDYCYYQYHLNSTGNTEIFYVQKSFDGGTTWSLLDSILYNIPGWGSEHWDISSQVAGHASVTFRFVYSDQGASIVGAALDNINVFAPAPIDAQLQSIVPAMGALNAFGAVNGTVPISGVIYNNGSTPITTFNATYSDGNPHTETFTATIAPFGTYTFNFVTSYTVPALGPHPMAVWVSETGDLNHANDTLHTNIIGVPFMPVHKVTFEEETGTWCGYCVRGTVYMDSMHMTHPNETELISVHNADPMTYGIYNTGATSILGFSGFPSIEVDRKDLDDPSNINFQYMKHINDFGLADLAVAPSFDWSTLTLTVGVQAHFSLGDSSGHYRLALVVTEDSVHSNVSGGTWSAGTDWDQHNYYGNSTYGLGPMGGFENLPETIPAASIWYNFVARFIGGTYTGTASSLPAIIPGGSTQNYSFTYNVPNTYHPGLMKAIVLLINDSTGQILNANSAQWTATGVPEVNKSLSTFGVYPNPFNDKTNVAFSLKKDENVTLDVYNMLGEKVYSLNNGTMSEGDHVIQLSGSNLTSGLYMVTLTAGDYTISRKVSINK